MAPAPVVYGVKDDLREQRSAGGPGGGPAEGSTVRVDRIAAGGDGVAREASGRVVFIPRTAPGDLIQVQVARGKKRWAQGRVAAVLERGRARRDPPCPWYDDCGGCQIQHLTLPAQREAKRDIVRQALRRIGGVEISVPELIGAGGEFGYRNRVTFSLARDVNSRRAGLRALDAPSEVTDVGCCQLAEPPIQMAWAAFREIWTDGASIGHGNCTRITIRCSSSGSLDMLLRGGEAPSEGFIEDLMARDSGLVGCHHAPDRGMPAWLAGEKMLEDSWQGIEFHLPADVFLQVNRDVSTEMDRWIDQRAGELQGRRVHDLYSGVGARAIRWALNDARVVACEMSGRAAAACREAATSAGADLTVLSDKVENRVRDLPPADLIVVNPPRAGLSRKVAEALGTASADAMVYVSCDPATLARDVARLGSSWALSELQPFDAFPQTGHVETIACLERR